MYIIGFVKANLIEQKGIFLNLFYNRMLQLLLITKQNKYTTLKYILFHKIQNLLFTLKEFYLWNKIHYIIKFCEKKTT